MTAHDLWILTFIAITALGGMVIGIRYERARCRTIVDAYSVEPECCGANWDSVNDRVMGPCCGHYTRMADGEHILREIG